MKHIEIPNEVGYEEIMRRLEEKRKQDNKEENKSKQQTSTGKLLGGQESFQIINISYKDVGIGLLIGAFFGFSMI